MIAGEDRPSPFDLDPISENKTNHAVEGLPAGGESAATLRALSSILAFCSEVMTFLTFGLGLDLALIAIFFFGFFATSFFAACFTAGFLPLTLDVVAFLVFGVDFAVALVAVAYD